MIVFAEQILIDNFLVDGCMLFCCSKVLGITYSSKNSSRKSNVFNTKNLSDESKSFCTEKSSKKDKSKHINIGLMRIALSAALGAILALIGAIYSGWVILILRIVCSPIMILIAFGGRCRFKKLTFSFFVFLGLSACLGGIGYSLLIALGKKTFARIPFGLTSLLICLISVGFSRLFLKLKLRGQKSGFVYRIEIVHNGKTIETDAYLDSGNLLHEPTSGHPVMIFDTSVMKKVFGDDLLEFENNSSYSENNSCGNRNKFKTIECTTVTGKGQIRIFEPERIAVYVDGEKKVAKDVCAGIAKIKEISDCNVIFGTGVLACCN